MNQPVGALVHRRENRSKYLIYAADDEAPYSAVLYIVIFTEGLL